MFSEKRYLIYCLMLFCKVVKFFCLLNFVIFFVLVVGRWEILGFCGLIDVYVFSIYYYILWFYLQVFFFYVLIMVDVMQVFNNVLLLLGFFVDVNFVFVDVLKRVKEVVMLLRFFKGVFMYVFIINFFFRLWYVWD